jgi:hypothetical protein
VQPALLVYTVGEEEERGVGEEERGVGEEERGVGEEWMRGV